MRAYLRSVASRFFDRSRVALEMDEELRSHIQLRADDLERSGMPRREAERRARVEFGGAARFQDECYEALGGNPLEVLLRDTRYSLRVLRKSPSFTMVAVLTLALAIGANAVVFGILNALILRPLNVPNADSLYAIQRGAGASAVWQSYPDYLDFRDRNRSFESVVACNIAAVGVEAGGNSAPAWHFEVSGNYFDALGIRPYLGRFFHAGDEHGPNSAPYVVLGHSYWRTHFQADPGVVGQTVRLNKHPYTVLGVAPPEFRGTLLFFSPDLFVPIVQHDQLAAENVLNARGTHWIFMVMGHLKPGVTPSQASADLTSIGAVLAQAYPKEVSARAFTLGRPSLVGDFLGRPVRAFMAGLTLLAGLILLAACANLGCLFAARAADRGREIALRLALGAGRGRILRQLFTESILIALMGGGLGLLASVALLRRLSMWQPFPRFPIVVPVSPDAVVYVVALGLALASGLLFGMAPVRQALRADPYQVVKSGTTVAPGRRVTFRDLLVVAQIAICAVLVTSSAVAVRGLVRSLHSEFGFDPSRAILANVDLNMAGYTVQTAPEMQRRIIDAVQAIPGVEAAGITDEPPLAMGGTTTTVYADQTVDLRPANAAGTAYIYSVSPEYFRAARTPLLAGRAFSLHDDKDAPRVAMVNLHFARKLFGSAAAAVGQHYKLGNGKRVEVAGVVADGKYLNLTEEQQSATFFPLLQSPSSLSWIVARASGDPRQLAPAIREIVRKLDPGLPCIMQTWDDALNGALFAPRVATVALLALGFMGAILSISGVFGMAAYSVSRRLKELGIRIAVGAQQRQVLAAALGRAIRLLAFGSAAGLALGLLATRVLSAIVYQATPRDPLVLAVAVLVMVGLGVAATCIPARRALSADPLRLLREE